MADLQVVAVLVATEGSEDVVRGALAELVAPTRAEEGCLSYELYASAADPRTFITVEHWRDQAAVDAHLQTPHIATAFQVAGDHLAAAPGIHPLVPVTNPL